LHPSDVARLSVPDRQEAILAALRACPLYFILDESLFAAQPPIQTAEEALQAGVRMLQLRTKKLAKSEVRELALAIRKTTASQNCLFIINDSLDLAHECGADGVHLGAEDMSVAEARAQASEFIIGGTARTCEAAWQAELDGADYVGCGSVFPSETKANLPIVGVEGLSEVNRYVSIPVVGIGGITMENCKEVRATQVAGFCSVAPFRTGDTTTTVKQFMDVLRGAE
jgi:thiamine-phosphate pyrophosphorylase